MKYVIALSGNPDYPWMHGEQLLYLGEIENCKGHGVYMQHSGKFHHGYHLDNFFEYTDTHYDVSERFGHCMSDFLRLQHGVFCLRYTVAGGQSWLENFYNGMIKANGLLILNHLLTKNRIYFLIPLLANEIIF